MKKVNIISINIILKNIFKIFSWTANLILKKKIVTIFNKIFDKISQNFLFVEFFAKLWPS